MAPTPRATAKAAGGKVGTGGTDRKSASKVPGVTRATAGAGTAPGGASASKRSPGKRTAARSSTGGASGDATDSGSGFAHHITSQEALENTRELLAAKRSKARKPPPWQEHDTSTHGKAAKSGFESESARDRATELHQDEMRLQANEGGISDRDRHQQGRRDNR